MCIIRIQQLFLISQTINVWMKRLMCETVVLLKLYAKKSNRINVLCEIINREELSQSNKHKQRSKSVVFMTTTV